MVISSRKTKAKNKEATSPDGVYNHNNNYKGTYLRGYSKLKPLVKQWKKDGLRLVLTSGTFDMVHIGHARYLEEAKSHGDILIVGVDSDAKVRFRKGPHRPIVPEEERMEILSHLRWVDIVVLKKLDYPRYSLIKLVRPDVLIATKETYTQKQIQLLKKFCKKIVVLSPRATTSTSAKIRKLQIGLAVKLENSLVPKINKIIEQTFEEFKNT